jgi:hypothetical protein
MATATARPAHAGELKLEPGVPQVFALKFLEPKPFEGSFGTRGMYTVADEGFGERKIWMDWEPASNLATELRRLKIQKGEPIQVTRVKHERGGGTGYLVARAGQAQAQVQATYAAANTREIAHVAPDDAAPEWVTTPTEALLERSVQMVRTQGPQVFRTPATREVRAITPDAPVTHDAIAPGAAALAAALAAAIDATLEATVYGARKGLELKFNEEDIRAKGGR